MKNDFHPSRGRIMGETILAGRIARRNAPCPDCGAPTDSYPMRAFPGCTGRACTDRRGCKWEDDKPTSTLDATGRLVRADELGRPTADVLFDPKGIGVAA